MTHSTPKIDQSTFSQKDNMASIFQSVPINLKKTRNFILSLTDTVQLIFTVKCIWNDAQNRQMDTSINSSYAGIHLLVGAL